MNNRKAAAQWIVIIIIALIAVWVAATYWNALGPAPGDSVGRASARGALRMLLLVPALVLASMTYEALKKATKDVRHRKQRPK